MKREETQAKQQASRRRLDKLVRCKDCDYFVRGRWKNMLTGEDEGPQCGGKCDVLQKALGIDNYSLWMIPSLYVQDAFGCVLGRTSNNKLTGAVGVRVELAVRPSKQTRRTR